MTALALIERLDHCRQTRESEWIARCPAHQDSSPSLTIKEETDGRVLVHCFAGCGALDVITAVGLEWSDLFPPSDRNYRAEKKYHDKTVDELVLEIAEADIAAGKVLSDEDADRELEAFRRQLLDEPSPEPDNAKDLFCTYAYRQQQKIPKRKKKVQIPEALKNQTVDEWLADFTQAETIA